MRTCSLASPAVVDRPCRGAAAQAIGDPKLNLRLCRQRLLRLHEGEQVWPCSPEHGASGEFASTPKTKFSRALLGVTDPGGEAADHAARTFIEVFDKKRPSSRA